MIRKIEECDRAEFLAMCKEFYTSPAVLHQTNSKNFEATLEAALNGSPYLQIYTIKENDTTAGYLQLSFTWSNEAGGLTVLVEELYIREAFRGRRLGTKCLEFVRETFPDAARLRLEVAPENDGAIRLYLRNGYHALDYNQMICDRAEEAL